MWPCSDADAARLCAAHPRLEALRAPLRDVADAAASGRAEAARAAALNGCAVAEALFGASDVAASAPLVLVWWLQTVATLFSSAEPLLDPDCDEFGDADVAAAARRAQAQAPEAWCADPARTLEPSRRAAALLRRRAECGGALELRPEESAWAWLLKAHAPAAPLRGGAAMTLLETSRALRLWPRALFDAGGEGQALLAAAATHVLAAAMPNAVIARCAATGRVIALADAAFCARAEQAARRALDALPPELRGGEAAEAALRRWAPRQSADAAAAEAASEAARRRGPELAAQKAAAARCSLPSCAAVEPFPGAFGRCGHCRRAAYCSAAHRVADTKRHAKEECTAAAAAARKARSAEAWDDAPKPKARASLITGLR